jgi:hypothetical protein
MPSVSVNGNFAAANGIALDNIDATYLTITGRKCTYATSEEFVN